MNDNYNYVLNNLGLNLTNNEWLMYVKNYFGEAETKNFCEYVIDARNICMKKDIRNMVYSGSMSIFSMIDNEQLAFLNFFRPIDTENIFVKNIGLEKIKKKYNKKDMKLDKEIKKYGYSYSKANFYFKSKNVKDTFQSKYINVVCSEKSTEDEFLKNIININKTKPIVELDYYSKEKQEKAKDFNPYSFNTAMLKMAFLQKFSSKEYNC